MKHRDLVIGLVVVRALQRQGRVVRLFRLVLVELRRRQIGRTIERVDRILPRNVGDLEPVVRRPDNQAEPSVFVEVVREVSKAVGLFGLIVDRIRVGGRCFDAQVVLEQRAGDVIREVARHATQIAIDLLRVVAAAHDAEMAALVEGTAFAVDGHDARRAIAVLGRERAGNQADLVGEAHLQRLSEAADGFRDDDVVDPVLKVAVVAANVQRSVGVLHDAGRLQEHLVQRRVVARRQILNVGP